jgi:hypothetical protein
MYHLSDILVAHTGELSMLDILTVPINEPPDPVNKFAKTNSIEVSQHEDQTRGEQNFPMPVNPQWSYYYRRLAELILQKVNNGLSRLEEKELVFLQRKTLATPSDVAAPQDDLVLAHETYEGYVLEVTDEGVLVRYDTGDDLVEQFYQNDQFQPGKVPAAGDRIGVDVAVKALAPLEERTNTGGRDEYRRKNVVSGDLRF